MESVERPARGMRANPLRSAILVALALVAVTLAGCGALSVAGARPPAAPTATATTAPTQQYTATLSALNASGVAAAARLDLTGNVLVITLHATGLEPNKEHYLHIHGYPESTVTCPAAGAISVDEGIAHVGPIALDLQPYPQVTGPGAVDWSHTYTLSPGDLYDIMPLTGHVLVLHGLTTNGAYNRATFVACGQIQSA